MTATPDHPRDLEGYRGQPPDPRWPGGARVALQFVLNVEEGAENSVLYGDAASETLLTEIAGGPPREGRRHLSMESLYEYGPRAGAWRILDVFADRGLPITLFAVAKAAERTPWIIERALSDGHEIASHGLRWIDYDTIPEDVERTHIAEAAEILTRLTGEPPLGWYTGRTSPSTRRLVIEHGGFLYDSDDYSDDLPFWSRVDPGHLIVPYTLDCNDSRFVASNGWVTGDDFYTYLRAAFDTLYEEGELRPKMMSIGLHARLIGRPGRIGGLKRFLNHVMTHEKVWIARRVDIARHWREKHAEV